MFLSVLPWYLITHACINHCALLRWETSYMYSHSLKRNSRPDQWLYVCARNACQTSGYIEGILSKGPYLPCVNMSGGALLAGYQRYVSKRAACFLEMKLFNPSTLERNGSSLRLAIFKLISSADKFRFSCGIALIWRIQALTANQSTPD